MPPTDSAATPRPDHGHALSPGQVAPAETGRPTGARPPLTAGDAVPVRWTKWPGTEHWEHECVWLGSDEHGDWLGQRAGTRSWRPGRDVVAGTANVVLVPVEGDWVATFYPPGHETTMEVYIDLGRSVGWSATAPAAVVGIDMDLDVVRDGRRGTWVDDEDELVEHAALWGYPPELVSHLEEVAQRLRDEVEAHRAPFDRVTPSGWLDRLASTTSPT